MYAYTPLGTYGQLNIAHSTKTTAKTPRNEEGASTARGGGGGVGGVGSSKPSPYRFPMKDMRI
ncbi:hypothetical protein EON63_23760, partial [archaeon]